MKKQLTSIRTPNAFIVLALTIPVLGLVAAPANAEGSEIRRTASGKPDLNGTYDISTVTPFTRPAEYGDRMALTEEEAMAIAEGRRKRTENLAKPSDPNRDAPPVGASVGAYNDFWMDWGTGNFKLDGKYRTSVLIDPPNGQMPEPSQVLIDHRKHGPRFDWGRNDGTAWWLENDGPGPYDGPEFNTPGVRCIYQDATTVPIRSLPYNNMYSIIQTETHVVIHVEWMHYSRVVRLDSQHAPPEVGSLGGDSIGWWEGDTLMVETTNFRSIYGLPQAGMRVVEQLSMIDGDSLRYKFTVEDPRYSGAYAGEALWPKSGQRLYEYACHEGNYAMGNMLRGARLLEEEWGEKKVAATGSSGD